jgi:hypothetical protein
MNADTFIYVVQRWWEVISENPQVLAEFANQERALLNEERKERDLERLSQTLKRTKP